MARILRLAVAVILTAIVFYQAHPADVIAAAAGSDFRWIAAAVTLVLLDRTLMALRWIDLLRGLTPGSRPRFPVVIRIFFVSSFVSNFVPGLAADMYRAYALARRNVHLAESTASVLMDRMLGVLSMVIVGACALVFARDVAMQGGLAAGMGITLFCCAAAGVIVFSARAAALVARMVHVLRSAMLDRVTASLLEAVRRYASHRATLLRVLAMSIAVQVLRVLQAWCLGEALGLDVPLLTYFVLVPVILLVMQVPITVNGLGTTQLAFVVLFAPLGVPSAQTFALSVLYQVLGVVGSLPGGVLYATTPALERTDAPPA